ncbi:MAG: hypothetical protein KTR32_31565 [Granulosicoccus sp.]|nr:hypothetical protein [Granulosicoccus sp.]
MTKSVLAAIAIESNRESPSLGVRPTEEEIIAWAEGTLPDKECARIKHWLARDSWTQSVYDNFTAYDEAALINSAAAASHLKTGSDSIANLKNATEKTLQRVTRYPAAFNLMAAACVALLVVGLVFLQLPKLSSPLGPSDFVDMAQNPAENWPYSDALRTTARGSIENQTGLHLEQQAFLFGIRSTLIEMGINKHPEVSTFYASLPLAYPLCNSGVNSCEDLYHWYYRLGQWSALTERICNTSLSSGQRDRLLESQQSVIETLKSMQRQQSLPVSDSIQVQLLASQNSNQCQLSDMLYRWSTR